jgi:hypothetical protein
VQWMHYSPLARIGAFAEALGLDTASWTDVMRWISGPGNQASVRPFCPACIKVRCTPSHHCTSPLGRSGAIALRIRVACSRGCGAVSARAVCPIRACVRVAGSDDKPTAKSNEKNKKATSCVKEDDIKVTTRRHGFHSAAGNDDQGFAGCAIHCSRRTESIPKRLTTNRICVRLVSI